ncbi:hypothetical protein PybrP1_007504, partial [[Pythium] brassicae (nom. inval.)]
PELEPATWMLTADEIARSRGGIPREDELNSTSQLNNATLFPSTDAYFASIVADVEAAGRGDVVWIAGWTLSIRVPLIPSGSKADADNTTLAKLVERAVLHRGAHVRILLWANLFAFEEVVQARDWLNALAPEGAAASDSTERGTCVCVFDDRLPHKTSAHHQKMIVVTRQNRLVAYVGGVDIAHDRWDTIQHNQAALRVERGVFKETQGWIDAALRLDGPSARDVAATFQSRWNSGKQPCVDLDDALLKFRNPPRVGRVELPALDAAHDSDASSNGASAHVQIVRTFSPHESAELYPDLAPRGELSLLEARVKAIGCAKNFVFVEDQYFFYMPQLLQALEAVLPRLLRLIVVVQRPTETRQARVAGYEKLFFQMAHPLLARFPDKVQIYTTKQARGLYIHSKVLLIDDVFVAIGSSNWNRRSSTSDSEIAAHVVSNAADTVALPESPQVRVGRLVRRFRLLKWMELTGVPVATLEQLPFVASCELLERATKDPASVLDALVVEPKWAFVAFPASYSLHVVDPDDLNGEKEE